MTIPTISTLPTAPARTDPPATFVTRADSFLAALVVMQGELNTSIGAMNTDIAQVNADAISAAASATAAENASNASAWVSGTTYSLGDVVYSPVNYQSYRRIVAGAGTTDPSADATNWTKISAEPLPTQTGNSGKYLTTDGTDASWDDVESLPSQAGNAGRYLTTDGSTTSWGSVAGGFTLAPMVSIGGTASATFTGIPSTATVIIINFMRCYQGGRIEVQIGDSGGIETSGYESSSARIRDTSGTNSQETSTTYFVIRGGLGSSDEYNGTMTLTCLDRSTNHWVSSHTLSSNGTPNFVFGGGQKALSGTLTQVKIGNGTYNSNAKVSIAYL